MSMFRDKTQNELLNNEVCVLAACRCYTHYSPALFAPAQPLKGLK